MPAARARRARWGRAAGPGTRGAARGGRLRGDPLTTTPCKERGGAGGVWGGRPGRCEGRSRVSGGLQAVLSWGWKHARKGGPSQAGAGPHRRSPL
jgi:hypothetical protein